jgi:hypothetical protein
VTATGWNARVLCLRAACAACLVRDCLLTFSCAVRYILVGQAAVNRAKDHDVRVDELQREGKGVGRFALACSCPNHLHLWSKLQPCLHLIRCRRTALEPSAAREPTCCLSQGLTSTALRRLWRGGDRDAWALSNAFVAPLMSSPLACSKHPS